MTDQTLSYYNQNAQYFAESTTFVDFSAIQNDFIRRLPSCAFILDFGCGAGRDTKYFLEHGFRVEAVDGSAEMCRLASVYTGIRVRQMLFQELDEEDRYDGIWACASLLHLNREELRQVFAGMEKALRKEGLLYASFKYGKEEGLRNGRYFTDMDEQYITDLLVEYGTLTIEKMWVTRDVRPGRNEEQWLNILIRKRYS